ncbi:hypothetical protein B0H14DRAFT_2648184 [Mycena olivaceomarginata]|nr:hypothetical protein B0H14DRAFT_2648184 [Mycena olivaceomarginata]
MIRGEKKDLTSGVTPHPMPGGLRDTAVVAPFIWTCHVRLKQIPHSPSQHRKQCLYLFQRWDIQPKVLLGRTRWLHVLFLLPNQLKRTNQLFESAHQLKTTSLYSPYQCQKDLIDDFSARLNDFIDAQAYHTRMGFPAFPVIFDFGGEYSIVAANYDKAGRKVAVDFRVNSIEDSVASVTGLTFALGPSMFDPMGP